MTILEFHWKEVKIFKSKYLIITTKELKMNSEKIKAVIKFLISECIKNIQAFQRLAKYYQKFITDFVNITASLINLLQKNKSFKWTESQKQAFQEIKEKFKEESILIHFDYKKSAIINANASKKAMRAQLQQINNEKQKQLIACYTWKLTSTEQQYNIHNKKMLAIIKALEKWRIYLQEAKYQTIIKSNHKNLQYFMTTKKLNEQQAQWAEILAEYDFIIQYYKEKDNNWADILNRKSDFVKKEIKKKEQAMLQINQKK